MAQDAARTYRLRGENVPHHVQAILDATSVRSIEETKPSEMKNIIESLLNPKPSRGVRQSFAFRKKQGDRISEKDRQLLDRLAGEIDEKNEEES
jgi:ribosomal protein S19E (S16A)